jgi:two-component system LytT family response regulator
MSREIRVLVVDDEYHARRGMRALLEDESDVEVVGEASSGKSAIESIRHLRPDVVFLDITMPDRSGLEVVGNLGTDRMPQVVFVTAYDQYAVKAFEANAIDYVLKPFSDDRFRAAMGRARNKVRRDDAWELGERLKQLLDCTTGDDGILERFTLNIDDRLKVFSVEQIDWIEAEEYYAKLHIGRRSHLVRQTLNSLESQLPPRGFARIHRSTIVNLDRVVALEPMFQGDCTVILQDGTSLRMSRRRRKVLMGLIKTFN